MFLLKQSICFCISHSLNSKIYILARNMIMKCFCFDQFLGKVGSKQGKQIVQ